LRLMVMIRTIRRKTRQATKTRCSVDIVVDSAGVAVGAGRFEDDVGM